MLKSVPWMVSACVLAGCMVGPDYERPAVDAPAAFRFEDKVATPNLADTRWWEQFQDPVLNGLIKTALEQNRDIQIAAARVEEFLGRFGVTRAQLFPQVGLQGQGGRAGGVDLDRQSAPSGSSNPYSSFALDLGVSWELDLWGKLRRATEAARADLLASEENRLTVILVAHLGGGDLVRHADRP